VRKQVLLFLLATGVSVGGIFTQPALADCTVNADALGATCDGGNCTVNLGTCSNGGTCTYNDVRCDGGACTIASGDCTNGDESLICLNTLCDGSIPPSEGYTALTCGMDLGGNEASGVLFNDPTKEFGDVSAFIHVDVADPTSNTVANTTIHCTMQTAGETYGLGGVSRSVTMSGDTAVLADTISFTRTPGASTWMCTTFEWNSTKGHSIVVDDADNNSSNGVQCAEVTYTN